MARVSTAILCVLFSWVSVRPVSAIEPRDASYFCVAEAAGGLSYDTPSKKWVGARFKTTEKFILRLKFIDVTPSINSWDQGTTYTNFKITMADAGSSNNSACISTSDSKSTISINPYNFFSCNSMGLSQYNFNLTTNRYLKIYDVGYISGNDNNDDTPAITGGICTKFE
jgi:hypothetical protein